MPELMLLSGLAPYLDQHGCPPRLQRAVHRRSLVLAAVASFRIVVTSFPLLSQS
jgi:hypothetical protein